MSSEQGQSLSSSSSEETDDISLTFWIFLWTFLAIIATWIYTKLNRGREIVEDSKNIVKGPDEQIARKLVNEISKNDLVKRSTFRRQRSYEIIDGEVRIHYDVSWAETNQWKKNYSGNNIMDLAEVDSFPLRRSSMEEMELIVPGSLPRIIEEGEEATEKSEAIEEEEIVYAREVSSEKTCQVLDRDIPVINVLNYEEELNSTPDIDTLFIGEEHELTFTKHVESSFEKEIMVNNLKINVQAPQAEQTNIPKITKTEAKKDKSPATEEGNKPAKNALLDNSCNSSSDEISSTSEESIIMASLQNTQTSSPSSVDRAVAMHSMNSTTTSSVYKMTEVAASEEHSFTVTRREITKLATRSQEGKCLESKPSNLSTHYTSMAAVECLENEKQFKDELKDDTSCHDGRQDKNVHSKENNDSSSTPTPGQNETDKEKFIITASIDEKQGNAQAGNLHKQEIADKWHLLEEKLEGNFDQ